MRDLRELLPGVRDQGTRGTCLTIAVTDGHHAVRGSSAPLSVDYLHYHAVRYEECGINEGVSSTAIREALLEDGQPAEVDCPYSLAERDAHWLPLPVSGKIWKRSSSCPLPTWQVIRAGLLRNEPVVLVLGITDEFWNASETLIDKADGDARARHAVLAVGLHDADSRVFVRNSWGEDWGQGGYAWISANYIQARCVSIITFGGEVP